MSAFTIIVGILLFAAAGAILYAWGLAKAMNQREDLAQGLKSACGSRIVKYLKKHDSVTEKEAAGLIEGVTVGPFWSKNKVKVTNGKQFAGAVLTFLTEQQYIEREADGSYCLKKSR